MQLNDMFDNAADQNRGQSLALLDPFTGQPTGMIFVVAGPDSDRARRARLALSDELAEMANEEGRVSAEDREAARLNSLAALVLDWNGVEEDGSAVTFSTSKLLKVLRVLWVQEQVDAFAGDRRNFAGRR